MKTELTSQEIAMYLGCECQTIHRGYKPEGGPSYRKIGKLMCIDLVLNKAEIWFPEDEKENLTNFEYREIKPILRPLSDMTEDDCAEVWALIGGTPHLGNVEDIREWLMTGETEKVEGIIYGALEGALVTQYLLSRGFDLFGYIEAGLAIDQKTINPQ